jgi:energy-coupling factor transporter ATP-binding protein EcfA2
VSPAGPTASGSAAEDAVPLVSVEKVWFAYSGATWALQDVSLNVGSGEYLALIGANGAGKTTLAKLCNGLLLPAQGRVRIRARLSDSLSPSDLAATVGYVFQNPDHQIFAASTRDEIAFGPRNLGLTDAEVAERVDEALSRFRLAEVAERPPAVLSLPTRRMVALAAVYAMRPRVLILDEPTGGLDGDGIRDVMRAIAELHAAGHSIVLITHDMALVAEQARRVILLHRGRVLLDASPCDCFSAGDSLRSAGLELPQITRLAERVVGRRGSLPVLSVADFVSAYVPAGPGRAARNGGAQ